MSHILSEAELARSNTYRNGSNGSNGLNTAEYNTWLREQLLAGKNSPLCAPLKPTHFDELRARVERAFANK
ncbi:MAG: hypothetical protein ACKO0Z_09270 [Betaproteobacteria bacterium]